MHAPALLVAVPLLVGVLAGATFPRAAAPALPLLGLIWLLAITAIFRDWPRIGTAAIVAGFLTGGVAVGARAMLEARQPSLLLWQRQFPRENSVSLTGVLREDATLGAAGVSLVVRARVVDGVPVTGGVRVNVAGQMAPAAAVEWRAGREVRMQVALRQPLDFRNPGVPSDRERLMRDGIVLIGSVKSAALVTVTARGGTLSETAAALRRRVRLATAAAVGAWHHTSGAVVTAILIGDRSGLDPELERRLQEAGTYHVIAISGGNIALLTALLVACGRLARLPRRGTAIASLALLAFYGYAAGLAPSVMRATIAGMLYLGARAADHRGTALNAIAVAAGVSAAIDPLTILDPGFVLSFGATFAIVIAASRVAPALGERRRRQSRARAAARMFLRAVVVLGAATICAEIALAPIGARLFGRVSIAGLLLNFVAIPLMSVIQIAGLAAVAIAFLSPSLASAAGLVAHVGTASLLGSAALVDVVPWLVVDLPPPAWWLMALWYVGWTVLLIVPRRRVRMPAIALVAVSGLLMLAGRPATRAVSVPRAPDGWTRIVFLDVGQGDATLIQPADGPPMLVDAGGVPGSSFDLGRRVTLPAAWAFGVIRLGPFVLTHGDPDHMGGALPLLRALRPESIWDGVPVPAHEPLRRLRAAASRRGIPWIARRAGDSLTPGGLRIRVLNPPDPDWERPKVRNDDSIVLEVRIGDVAFILPGDITRAVEPSVIERLDPAPLTIVKAPHHGSAGSSSQLFVDALRPSAVIFSAGKRNPFGHPAPVAVARYKAAGAKVFSTADDGAVVVETDGKRVVAWTWRSPSTLVTLHGPTARLR